MSPENALEAFMRHRAEALEYVDEIRASLDAHLGYDPERINWGHAGTMAGAVDKLRELSQAIP